MKRPSIPKRRNRRSGLSPYARRNKTPFQYSNAYQSWRSQYPRGKGVTNA